MAANTKIEWTDRTWNPVRGCSMASGSETGGCLHCYAARMAARNLPEMKSPSTGKSFARMLESGPRWTGDLELIERALPLPLQWRSPKRIFVNSMSDLFHEALPDEAIDRVFAVMAWSPQHTFQVLTKRPERMLRYLTDEARVRIHRAAYGDYGSADSGLEARERWPLPNLWLGTSVENQATADARIPLLLQVPAAVHFVSYEPALGPVDFTRVAVAVGERDGCPVTLNVLERAVGFTPRIDWIIAGGESGPGARPFDLAWARSVVEQCEAAGTACFVKQFGAKPESGSGPLHHALKLRDKKGGDWDEWPPDLRVRQFPEIG